jgi:hypothetical protein
LEEPLVSCNLLEDWLGDRAGDSADAMVQSVKRYERLRRLDSDIQHVLGEDEITLWWRHQNCVAGTTTAAAAAAATTSGPQCSS